MKLRWCLPPLAMLFLAGTLWITLHGGVRSPEALLESARARLSSGKKEPAERALARRELDEGLRLAQGPELAEFRAELLDERSRVYAEEGALELALSDCRARLEEWGASTEALARAGELCLRLGEPELALAHAEHLAAIDPVRGQGLIGRCRVALADLPLAAIGRMAHVALLPSVAAEATTLAQRAAVFADDGRETTVALEELLALFPRPDERRRAGEWVREAAEHLRAARGAFSASLAPGSTGEAAAGLQDLLLRGGAEREAADLGALALSLPNLEEVMPVLARTASALAALGREGMARGLILDVKKRRSEALEPEDLPSLALRDELLEWCRLLERLELWQELRAAAEPLCERAQKGSDPAKTVLAHLLAGTAELRLGQLAAAQRHLDAVGTRPAGERELTVRAWLARAELARRQGERAQERYALLLVTKSAPKDPPPELREAVRRAWQRLSELQMDEGNPAGAEVSLTHALRCSGARAAEVEPLWHEIGRKALATRGGPYVLYMRAKIQEELGQPALALADARALLEDFPGLGPALEVLSHAANDLCDYPLMISSSLELMERGWPAAGASERLRRVPEQFFLPQDRVRWLLLDPRGSLEAVVRRLLARGNLRGAALAARGGPSESQPPELLPLLARVAFDAGDPATALRVLALLPAESQHFRSCTGLALRAAQRSPAGEAEADALAPMVAKVLESGAAQDAELATALDGLLAAGRRAEAQTLLAWLAPQSPSFLGELLLRQVAARVLARASEPIDEDLERAAALVDDGRAELGRLILALENGDEDALANEARVVLDTPFARAAARRAALQFLAGAPAEAVELLPTQAPDGRELLAELVRGCLPALASGAPVSAALLELFPAQHLLVLSLALESAPWNVWALARLRALEAPAVDEPWLRALLAQGWLALGAPAEARGALGPRPPEGDPDARLAWLRVRVERREGAPPEVVRAAELDWFERSGRTRSEDPALAALEAARAVQRGAREEGARILEAALEARPDDPELRLTLAELENVSGRRTRAIELASLALASGHERADDARVLFLLEVLRSARDEGEIREERWWAELEALEAERPEDPAPVRELAARAFEVSGSGGTTGRALALERLTRFRARTLDRSLETLRAGEGELWIDLLARHAPERAVSFADEELRRDPSDPGLWRASARALLAAGRRGPALERLTALHTLAPEPETARLLALTSFRVENDPARFAERLAGMRRFDPRVEDDPELAFHGALFAAAPDDEPAGLQRALELWSARAENGLASPELGRTLALRLFYAARRAPALAALEDANALAHSALERDVLLAMAYLVENAPAKPLKLKDAPPPPAVDDAPAQKGKGQKAGAKAAGGKAAAGRPKDAAGQRTPAAGARNPGAKAAEPAADKGKAASPEKQPAQLPKAKNQKAPRKAE